MTRQPIRRNDESGVALVLALIFVVLFGVWVGTILTLSDTNLRATAAIRGQRVATYELDGALNAAVAVLRQYPQWVVPPGGTEQTGICTQAAPKAPVVVNYDGIVVSCTYLTSPTGAVDSLVPDYGPTGPPPPPGGQPPTTVADTGSTTSSDSGSTTPTTQATTCGENSFLGKQSPAAGVPVRPGDTISQVYIDESPVNQVPPLLPTGSITSPDGSYTRPLTVTVQGSWNSTSKSQLLQATVPSDIPPGTYEVMMQAWDSDQNKPGGDCGISSWVLNVGSATQSYKLLKVDRPVHLTATSGPGGSVLATADVTLMDSQATGSSPVLTCPAKGPTGMQTVPVGCQDVYVTDWNVGSGG